MEDGYVLYMGDDHFAPVHGKEHSKAYRFYVIEPNDSVSVNSIIESRDAIFDENHFSLIPRPKNIIPNSDESQRDDHSDDVPSEISETRKVLRRILEPIMKLCNLLARSNNDEIVLLLENNTCFKARLVNQEPIDKRKGSDYFDTYAPVARITTIKLLLALAAIHNLVIHQMDVKIAFLNGDLDEELYMKQPEGFVMLGNEHKKFNREDCSPVSTPMDPVEKLKPNTSKPVDQLEYSRAIGCLMYAMTSTRPDIAYTVDSSSTRGWVFLLGGGAISWASKKQTCITGSTMESEFVALAAAGKEAEWLRNLIHEIPIWPKPIAPISIRCDSAPTMAKAYSQIYNGKSRYLGVRHSMVRELIRIGMISIEFVRMQHNLAGYLTKGLAIRYPLPF
ncbi:zinc finger, CCHC-type containing protein [Tanacetum coccineum]